MLAYMTEKLKAYYKYCTRSVQIYYCEDHLVWWFWNCPLIKLPILFNTSWSICIMASSTQSNLRWGMWLHLEASCYCLWVEEALCGFALDVQTALAATFIHPSVARSVDMFMSSLFLFSLPYHPCGKPVGLDSSWRTYRCATVTNIKTERDAKITHKYRIVASSDQGLYYFGIPVSTSPAIGKTDWYDTRTTDHTPYTYSRHHSCRRMAACSILLWTRIGNMSQ